MASNTVKSLSKMPVAALRVEVTRLQQQLEEAERRNSILLSSLQHRVRNTLAIIRSVASRTAQASGTVEDFQAHLDARLSAIARAQMMALRDVGESLLLEQLLGEELLAHAAHEGERISLDGPAVRLGFAVAGPLGLAVHELVSNAVKHGALSVPQGRIKVSWQVKTGQDQEGHSPALRLDWQETGMPAVGPAPRRRGFGTEMIEQTLPYELGAAASLSFGPDGVHCTIILPVTGNVTLDVPAPP